MITIRNLTKVYGDKRAVDDLTFDVHPGQVTGFLGPNGAGKSTTMRAIMGLDRPTAGEARVNGRALADFPAPLHEVGALLEARAIHPGRSARDHLMALAATNGISGRRVDEVVELVGLTPVARRRAGAFSLGMGQRLGLATALLGDPEILILDEPVNGLDPDGVLWVRNLMKDLAAQGRTVFVSSHLISEMALTADHLIIVGRGRLIRDVAMTELMERTRPDLVRVRCAKPRELAAALLDAGASVTDAGRPGELDVHQMDSTQIGEEALRAGVAVYELTPQHRSLEEIYMDLTHDAVEYHPGELGRRTARADITAEGLAA